MGLLDIFRQQKIPLITTILPDVAKQEILNGRLPILLTDKIFLKQNEVCHYIDKAIYEKKTVKKRYIRRNNGYRMPGLFKGTNINIGNGYTDVDEDIQYDNFKGIIYLTNMRIIFVCSQMGFEKEIKDLVAATPYSNCIELQFKKETYKIFIPDGIVINKALHLIR